MPKEPAKTGQIEALEPLRDGLPERETDNHKNVNVNVNLDVQANVHKIIYAVTGMVIALAGILASR